MFALAEGGWLAALNIEEAGQHDVVVF